MCHNQTTKTAGITRAEVQFHQLRMWWNSKKIKHNVQL